MKLFQVEMKNRLVIFFVLMGSYLGFYFSFPLFPTIFLNSNYNFLPESFSPGFRSVLLGITYAAYYLGSFIGTPIIGKASDVFGKKKILSTTFLLVGLMYLLSIYAIYLSSLSLLIIFRFLTGFFDGCYPLAYATLLSLEKSKSAKLQNFEFWTTLTINFGWISGTFVGWNLIAHPSLPITYLFVPFFCASIIYLTCFSLISIYFFEEKLHTTKKFVFEKSLFFSTINSFRASSVRSVLISNTSFYAATSIFSSYIPIFLMRKYKFEPAVLGTIEMYISIAYCLAPFTYWLYLKYLSRKEIMCISALGTAISLISLLTIHMPGSLWIFLMLTSYFNALGFSFSSILITEYSPDENHGEALGTCQALFILIEASVSFLCGLSAAIWIYLPLIIAITASLFSAIWILHRLLLHPNQIKFPI
jgi:MFS family permease